MATSAAQIGLNLFAKLSDAKLSGREKSLISATKGARFEPIVLVDTDMVNYEGVTDIMQSAQALFTGYLLQAISLYGNVGGTKAIKELDRFNPSRDSGTFGEFAKSLLATESYSHRLPTPKKALSLEAFDTNSKRYSKAYKVAIEESFQVSSDKDSNLNDSIQQSTNLSVGRIYNVDFTSNGQKVTVPITIRLISMIVPSERLAHVLTVDATRLTDSTDRFYAWRAGRINFISDLILARDLLKQHRQEIMNDKDGIYSNILKRRVSNNTAAIASGAPSLAGASNIVVISSDTARLIEQKVNGKLSNPRDRDRIMGQTSIMLLIVADKFADQVIFYSEGISEPTHLTLRQLKSSSKSSGPDVSEILKAYQLGMSPSTL